VSVGEVGVSYPEAGQVDFVSVKKLLREIHGIGDDLSKAS